MLDIVLRKNFFKREILGGRKVEEGKGLIERKRCGRGVVNLSLFWYLKRLRR